MNTGLQDWLQDWIQSITRTDLARCIPWNLQYCSALYQLACKFLTLTPSGHFGYILHLEKDTQVVFLLSQRGEGHREPASCVATTGRVCAAWRKYDINTMDVNTLSKFWMPFSFIIIALVKQPCTVCPSRSDGVWEQAIACQDCMKESEWHWNIKEASQYLPIFRNAI